LGTVTVRSQVKGGFKDDIGVRSSEKDGQSWTDRTVVLRNNKRGESTGRYHIDDVSLISQTTIAVKKGGQKKASGRTGDTERRRKKNRTMS